MTDLPTTAIMQTDIRDATVQFRMLRDVDLNALLSDHRQQSSASGP